MLRPSNRSQTYHELFLGIESGAIKIPKFQRDFVWSLEQTAGLIDSLLKGYPIGSFTYWETTDELRHVRDIGNHKLPNVCTGHPVSYVLDGQQRITSLFAVRKGVVYRRLDGADADYKQISIDLSLDPDDDLPVVFPKPPAGAATVLTVHELLNSDGFKLFRKYKEEEHQRRIETYKTRLENYSFSTVVIGRQYSIDIATDVFTRINTGGTGLTLFEVMSAKTYSESRQFDLAEEYHVLVYGNGKGKCLADVGYETVDPATVLRCVAMCLGRETSRREILRLDKDKFIDAWTKVKRGVFAAVAFLRKALRIPVSRLLPYDALLVPLAYFFTQQPKPTNSQRESLQEYFWWASMSRRFSSAVDTGLAADRRRMRTILKDKAPSYASEYIALHEDDLIYQVFSTGEARCKALLCLYSYHRPRSFDAHEEVTLDNSWLLRIDSKNYHHFFPRAYLRDRGVDDWYANSVLNITIVDEDLNKRRIRARAPSDYMKDFSAENSQLGKTMRTHLVNDLDSYGVWSDDYDAFLAERAKVVLGELQRRLPSPKRRRRTQIQAA